jgi:hypothetical protein
MRPNKWEAAPQHSIVITKGRECATEFELHLYKSCRTTAQ